jgi:hypothetical protein
MIHGRRSGKAYDAFPSGHAMHVGALASAVSWVSPKSAPLAWSLGGLVAATRIVLLAHCIRRPPGRSAFSEDAAGWRYDRAEHQVTLTAYSKVLSLPNGPGATTRSYRSGVAELYLRLRFLLLLKAPRSSARFASRSYSSAVCSNWCFASSSFIPKASAHSSLARWRQCAGSLMGNKDKSGLLVRQQPTSFSSSRSPPLWPAVALSAAPS